MVDKTPNHELSEMRCPISLEDVDLFSPGAQEHWYEAYEILHRDSPIVRIPGEGLGAGSDGFVLTKYEDIAKVVRDPVRYPPSMSLAVERMIEADVSPDESNQVNAMMASILTLRPTIALWRSHRQELTDPWVGPGANRHRAMITATVDELIDSWIDRGEVELISEFARPLPQRVMASVLGFPREDIPDLARWGEAQVEAFVYGRGHRNELSPEQTKSQFERLAEFKESTLR